MNNKYLVVFLIGVLGIGVLFSALAPPHSEISEKAVATRGPLPMTFIIEAENPLDQIDSNKISCYEITPEEFDLNHFKSVSHSLGINGDIEFADRDVEPDTFLIKDEDKSLKYHIQTGVWFYSSDGAYPFVLEQPDIPSDEKTLKTAVSFLKENELWSDDLQFSHITYNYQRKEDKVTDEIYEEFVISKKVWFNREVQGIQIAGTGSKCSVTLGDDGKIVGFIQPKQSFHKTREDMTLIQPGKALENFKYGRGIKCISRTNLANETVTIKDISLCYHVDSLKEKSSLITPSYIFTGTLVEGNEFKGYTDAFIK